jgi:hypothetical protein
MQVVLSVYCFQSSQASLVYVQFRSLLPVNGSSVSCLPHTNTEARHMQVLEKENEAQLNGKECTCRALDAQGQACVPGAQNKCMGEIARILTPFTAACAEAFQSTYNISGGTELFYSIAEAAVDLDIACRAFITQVKLLSDPLPLHVASVNTSETSTCICRLQTPIKSCICS